MNRTMDRPARYTAWGLFLVGGLLTPSLMHAQTGLDSPPAPGPAPAVHLGDHTFFTLPNGLRVIVVPNTKLPIVSVQARFDVPPVVQGDKAGYVDLMGELFASGTATRSKNDIDGTVDRLGADLNTTNDGVYATGLKKNLPELLEVMADVVSAPTFPDAEFYKARQRTLSGVQQRKEDPDAIATVIGRMVTFGGTHPYGEVTTETSLGQIEPGHLRAYYRRFIKPDKGYLVFVGDITDKEARELAKTYFGKWKVRSPARKLDDQGAELIEGLGPTYFLKEAASPRGVRRVFLVDRPGAAQSVIRVAFPLNLQPKDIRAMNAQVMNTILGGGVFNARLMQNLREDKGYTYGAYASTDIDRFNGSFTISVSVRTEVTDSAITEIIKEMELMRDMPVTEEELELAKRFMAGSFARNLEDPRTVARFVLNTYLNDLPKDHYAKYLERLEKVSVGDVQAAARAFLHPDRAVILVVGDKRNVADKLAPFGMDKVRPVIELDENGQFWKEEITPATVSLEQVMKAYLAARGGRNELSRIDDMRVDLTAMVGGMPIHITNWYGANGRYRSETTMGSNVLQEVILDGERAVSKSPQGQQELKDIDLLDLKMNAMPVQEVDLNRFAERSVLNGVATIDGKEVYKVTHMTRAGTSLSDYFDKTTGLKVRRVDEKFMQGRTMVVTTDFADYRPVDGLLFPFRMVQSGGPMGTVTLEVQSVKVNQGGSYGFFMTGLPDEDEEEDDPGYIEDMEIKE
jgi:zinc protease